MQKLLPLIMLAVVALIVLAVLRRLLEGSRARAGRGRLADEPLPYRRKDYLLSQAERSFYEVLRVALEGSDLQIFPKVRLLDLLWLPSGTSHRQSHLNRVMSKHVDLVICDRQHLRPLLVIELDDISHEAEDRQARDVLVGRVLAAAGLPILRCPARRSYHVRELAQQVHAAIAAQAPPAVARP